MTSIRPIATIAGASLAGVAAGVGVDAAIRKSAPGRRLTEGLTAGSSLAVAAGAAATLHGGARVPVAALATGLAAGIAGSAMLVDGATTPAPASAPRTLKRGDMLPDGQQAAPETVYMEDGHLRFDSVIGNGGAAPFQIALHMPTDEDPGSTTQVIYNADGTGSERPLQGGLRLDPREDHSHLHFDDFSYFQLYKADEAGRPDLEAGELAQGVKQSFYITDVQEFGNVSRPNRRAAASLDKAGRVDRNIVPADVHQGISVGWADVYGAGLEGQSLEVGDLAPGRYVLRETFDPNDEVLEQDERNNTADTLIKVSADEGVKMLSSNFAPKGDYVTLEDGRQVIPAVAESMEKNVHDHADHEHDD